MGSATTIPVTRTRLQELVGAINVAERTISHAHALRRSASEAKKWLKAELATYLAEQMTPGGSPQAGDEHVESI